MSMTQADLLRKAAGPIEPGDFIAASGLLAPEQATAFLDLVYDATPMNAAIRHVTRRSKSGTIAKIGIGRRLLRKKTAGVDDATLAKPDFYDLGYATVASRLDWEVDEEVFQQNVEGDGFEDHLARLMGDQVGRDLEDLHLNGDTTDVSVDAPFLTQNDGWLRQLATGGLAHRVNGATINAGKISKGHFFAAIAALPVRFLTDRMRFILNPANLAAYAEYLSNRATAAGDAALIAGRVEQIASIPTLPVNSMPLDRIILADPQNFVAVNTQEIRRRKTTEGRQAIRQDKRFYAIFLDDDPIIETPEAIADVYGLS